MDALSSLSLTICVAIVLLWAGLWVVRRAWPNSAAGGGPDCAVVRSLSLGPRERVVVVRIAARHLVLGVGSTAISLLCELEEPLPPVRISSIKFADTVRKAAERWRGD